jgi:hypothetical protein
VTIISFQNNFHRQLPESQNKLLEEGDWTELVRDFKEARGNFIFDFLHKQAAKFCENNP